MKLVPINRRFTITGFYTAFPFQWNGEFIFHGESHDFWEIIYVARGEVESTEDEKIYRLSEGNLILHAPMEFHRIRSAGGDVQQGMILSFQTEGDLPEELRKGIFSLDREEQEEYGRICQKIIAFVRGETAPYAGQEAAERLSSFLIRLSGTAVNRTLVASGSAKEYRAIISDMTERVCENLTLSDFSETHSISLSYLKLLFRKYAGISPKTYYNQLRARHAARLLSEGFSAAEVADRMNFSSQNYFTVFFHNHMGCNPSEYKNRNR